MANFIRDVQTPPASIGRLSVTFATQDSISIVESVFTFQILDIDGRVIKAKAGELSQYMTVAQQNAIANFISQLRTKAVSEVI